MEEVRADSRILASVLLHNEAEVERLKAALSAAESERDSLRAEVETVMAERDERGREKAEFAKALMETCAWLARVTDGRLRDE